MTQAELQMRQERATRETFVIAHAKEGYRVYAPTNPKQVYLVSGEDDLQCTCPDFEKHADDPEWQCKHVLAVRLAGGPS